MRGVFVEIYVGFVVHRRLILLIWSRHYNQSGLQSTSIRGVESVKNHNPGMYRYTDRLEGKGVKMHFHYYMWDILTQSPIFIIYVSQIEPLILHYMSPIVTVIIKVTLIYFVFQKPLSYEKTHPCLDIHPSKLPTEKKFIEREHCSIQTRKWGSLSKCRTDRWTNLGVVRKWKWFTSYYFYPTVSQTVKVHTTELGVTTNASVERE